MGLPYQTNGPYMIKYVSQIGTADSMHSRTSDVCPRAILAIRFGRYNVVAKGEERKRFKNRKIKEIFASGQPKVGIFLEISDNR
jgi:hypothetical protein